MIEQVYAIREAAKELGVELHALRYWEEELGLSIGRNEQGRRFYTEENMQIFRQIGEWKRQGLTLKDMREILHPEEAGLKDMQPEPKEKSDHHIIMYCPKDAARKDTTDEERIEKAKRLQELLKQFIAESIKESNAELLEAVKEGLIKELDYQFRLQEEREAEREKVRTEKEDAHFKSLDEHLRSAMEKRGRKKRKGIFRI